MTKLHIKPCIWWRSIAKQLHYEISIPAIQGKGRHFWRDRSPPEVMLAFKNPKQAKRPRFWKSLSFFEKKSQLQFKLLAKSFLHGTWKMYCMHSTTTCRCFHLFPEKTQRKENISQHSSAGMFSQAQQVNGLWMGLNMDIDEPWPQPQHLRHWSMM